MSSYAHSAWPWLLFLVLLFATVSWKLARNRAFVSRIRPSATAPALLTVAATLLIAGVYLGLVIRNPGALPAVPKFLLTVLAAANAIYLASQARKILIRRFTKSQSSARLT